MQHSQAFVALCHDAVQRIKELTVDEVESMQLQGTPFVLIDVRDQDEFDAGHIEGAHFMSKGWIEAKVHHLVDDPQQKVVLYCGGGNRSALAADNLQKMGYTDVYSMQGGFKGWVKQGKPTI